MAGDVVEGDDVESAIVAQHAARVAAADPYVAGHDVLPPAGPAGQRLDAAAGESVAIGTAVTLSTSPRSANATWGPLAVGRLRARVAGPQPAAGLAELLDRWQREHEWPTGTEPGDRGFVVGWPSRDSAPVGALERFGFAPSRVVALRSIRSADAAAGTPPVGSLVGDVGAGEAATAADLLIRRANADDLDSLVELLCEMVAYDAQFGWIRRRPSTPAGLRKQVAEAIGWGDACWVATDDGSVIGTVAMQPPAHAGWLAPATTASPVAYLAFMAVVARHRGQAVGSALVAQAHRVAHGWGAAAVLLHHVLPNPLSTPFWMRHGYRPLITEWTKPA